MDAHTPREILYIIATPPGEENLRESSRTRSRLEELLPEPLERRELPGVNWGFTRRPGARPGELDRAREGDLEAVLCGDPVWMEPLSPRACSAAELLRVWAHEGPDSFLHLDNLSLALVAERRSGELILATDVTGGVRLYQARIGASTVLCTSYLLLCRLVTDREADTDSIATFLHLGYFPGRRTALRAVSVHPFGATSRIRGGTVETRPAWRPCMSVDRTRGTSEILEDVVRAFNTTVREYTAGQDRLYLAMTAGLDSRTVASSLLHQKIPFRAYTHGFPGCWEGQRVDRIVKRHEFSHRFIPLMEDFTDRLRDLALESFRATEGEISCIEKSHLLYVLSQLREEAPSPGTALLLGGGAGMLKGTFYRLLRDQDPPTTEGVDAYLRWNLSRRLPDIFAPQVRARDPGLLREFVTSAFEEVEGGSLYQKLDYLYLVRYRRWAGSVKEIYRRFFRVREPFVSFHLLDRLFRIDPPIKKAESPHHEILARNHPALQYDLTNKMCPALPFTLRTAPRFLPSAWWRMKQVLRGFSRRYLPRELFPLVDYVDYRTWIRRESGRALLAELLDPAAMRSGFLYDGDRLAEWLAQQETSGYPGFALMDKMCTLELYFREIAAP